MVTNATVHGLDDKQLVTCVTTAAKRVRRASPTGAAERCSLAYGQMPVAELPALAIAEDAITLMGNTLAESKALFADTNPDWKLPAVTEAITRRVSAVTSQSSPVVSAHGPLVVQPVDSARMKVVNRVLASVLASGDDFVLAVNNGATWDLLTPLALPVVPVPFGTGGVWNHIRAGSHSTDSAMRDPERISISILVREASVWLGLSRVNESTEIKRDAATLQSLGAALRAHRERAQLKGRTDVEIAVEDPVAYRDFVGVVQTAVAEGFVDWQLTDPSSLSARPMR
jgi:hypothetical protein